MNAQASVRPSIFVRRLRVRGWTWAHRLSQAVFLGLLLVSRHLNLESIV